MKFRLASGQMTELVDKLADGSNGFNIRGAAPDYVLFAPFFGTGKAAGSELARMTVLGNTIEVDASIAPTNDAYEFFWACFGMLLADVGATVG